MNKKISMELLEKLKCRYATKAMNNETVPQEKVDRIIEAARLAPTSSGLQLFEIIVNSVELIKRLFLEFYENFMSIDFNRPQPHSIFIILTLNTQNNENII